MTRAHMTGFDAGHFTGPPRQSQQSLPLLIQLHSVPSMQSCVYTSKLAGPSSHGHDVFITILAGLPELCSANQKQPPHPETSSAVVCCFIIISLSHEIQPWDAGI